jgi:hypothetical protein
MTTPEIVNIFKIACQEKKACSVTFVEEPLPRIVNPVGVCFSPKRELVLVCVQTDGYSQNNLPQFVNLLIDHCDNVELLNYSFKIQSGAKLTSNQCDFWLFHTDMHD